MRKYGPVQSIQDDNQTFHLLKTIQDETHHQEMKKYGPLQSIQDDNQTFHLLQAIQHELHHKHGTITNSVCFRNSLTYAKLISLSSVETYGANTDSFCFRNSLTYAK